jgi:hypothetical protein
MLNRHMDEIIREGGDSGRVIGVKASYTPKIRDENLEDAAALAGKGFSAHCGQCNGG